MGALVRKTGSAASGKPAARAGGAGFKFAYKPRSAEEVRERASRALGGRDSFFNNEVQYFTPREGTNTVRILPPPPDADWGHYGKTLYVHYDIGADSSSYLCLDKMNGEPCPICEARTEASRKGEDELAKELKPGERVAFYVIDRSQEAKGPLVWNCAAGTDKDIVKLMIDPTTNEVLPVDDPNEGYDLTVIREGSGLKTKYKGIQFARRASPLSDDPEVAEKWLRHITEHPIEQCLVLHDYEHISKVFEGQAPAASGEETPPETTKAAAGEPAARKRPAPRGGAARPAEPETAPATGGDEEKPTWEQLLEMNDDEIANLGEEFNVDFPDKPFDDIEELRAFVADALEIERPAEEAAPAASAAKGKPSWKDRLGKMNKK